MSLPPYEWIDTAPAWSACLDVLRQSPRIAVDLEANSLYAYRERVCLIQISVPGHDYIVDPLAGFDFGELGALLADEHIEKVFHSSDYDFMLLKSEFDWEVRNLFDTMWAGRILGETKMGLASFLNTHFGVTVSKRHQKANWGQRPLPENRLEYAQMDTHYLLELRDLLAARLNEAGLMAEALEIFRNACHVVLPDRSFDPEGFWSLRGARDLPPAGLAILREVYAYREQKAKSRDLPVFKVMMNECLVALAREAPTDLRALKSVKGLSSRLAEQEGGRILSIIRRARQASPPRRPVRKRRHAPGVADRYKCLMEWRKGQAQERGVESDVIMTRNTMWEIAEKNPSCLEDLHTVSSLGPHRRELYGSIIIEEFGE